MSINIDIKNLECFIVVADLLNFHKAAAKLYTSQSALSRRIQKLESSLEVELFMRQGRGITLTEEGKDFYKRAHKIVNEVDHVLQDYKNYCSSGKTTLNIACVPSLVLFFIPEILKIFYTQFPQIKVIIHDVYATEIRSIVNSGIADIGISFELPNDSQTVHNFTSLTAEKFMLIVNENNPLAQKQVISWDDVKHEQYISIWKGSRNRNIIDHELLTHNIIIKPFYEVRHASTALGLVAKNLGISVLPYTTLPPKNTMGLVYKDIQHPEITRNLGIIHHSDNTPAKTGEEIIANFIAITKKVVKRDKYLKTLH